MQRILDDAHCLICDWHGMLLSINVEANRLKPYHINLRKVENGELVTVSNIRKPFDKLRKFQEFPTP